MPKLSIKHFLLPVALALVIASPGISQTSVGLGAKLDAAEKQLESDIKACKPIDLKAFDALVAEANNNWEIARKIALKSKVPFDEKQLTADKTRADKLREAAKAAACDLASKQYSHGGTSPPPYVETKVEPPKIAPAAPKDQYTNTATAGRISHLNSEGVRVVISCRGDALPARKDEARTFERVEGDLSTEGLPKARDATDRPCEPASSTTTPTGAVGQAPVLDKVSEQLLAAHNKLRAEIGSPPLQWDPQLAANATAHAQLLASGVPYAHASRAGREKTERENLSKGLLGWTPEQMIQSWLDEKPNFVPGIFPNVSKTGDWYKVGHYSQMVWAMTLRVGCGQATSTQWSFLVCRYSPPGNQDGKPVLASYPGAKLEQPDLAGKEYMPKPTNPLPEGAPQQETKLVDFGNGLFWDPVSQVTVGPGTNYVDVPIKSAQPQSELKICDSQSAIAQNAFDGLLEHRIISDTNGDLHWLFGNDIFLEFEDTLGFMLIDFGSDAGCETKVEQPKLPRPEVYKPIATGNIDPKWGNDPLCGTGSVYTGNLLDTSALIGQMGFEPLIPPPSMGGAYREMKPPKDQGVETPALKLEFGIIPVDHQIPYTPFFFDPAQNCPSNGTAPGPDVDTKVDNPGLPTKEVFKPEAPKEPLPDPF